MHLYYAIVHKDDDSAFGVSFPDLDGCFSAADDEEDVLHKAQEALALYISGLDELPAARSIQDLRKDPAVVAELNESAFVIAVPLITTGRKARYNLMLDQDLVAGIDRAARAGGVSRSEFVGETLSERIKAEGGVVTHKPSARSKRLNAIDAGAPALRTVRPSRSKSTVTTTRELSKGAGASQHNNKTK